MLDQQPLKRITIPALGLIIAAGGFSVPHALAAAAPTRCRRG